MSEPLRIDQSDLFTPEVEDYLDQRMALSQGLTEIDPQPLLVRLIYSNYFYLSVASMVGALVGWAVGEPFFDDNTEELELIDVLLFPIVTACVGMFLGAAEGIICRNYGRAALSAGVGLAVGFIGSIVLWLPTEILFAIAQRLAGEYAVNHPRAGDEIPPLAWLILMFGRSIAWSISATPAGLGQGLALRQGRVAVNGLLGAILGGLIGGLLFDPISFVLRTGDDQVPVSRAVGFGMIGLMVGFFVGLVEQFTKSAWLLMRAGPLAGKQFVLYRQPTVLGSSPKADVYLFKDDAIEPRHALIHNRGGRFEIEDCNTPSGTFVNGSPVRTQILKSGDQIRLGKTVLEFSLKETA